MFAPSELVRTVLVIRGMRGNPCRERVLAALEAVGGVKEADVNLYRGTASVAFAPPCHPEELVRAVVNAGYEAAPRQSRAGAGATPKPGVDRPRRTRTRGA